MNVTITPRYNHIRYWALFISVVAFLFAVNDFSDNPAFQVFMALFGIMAPLGFISLQTRYITSIEIRDGHVEIARKLGRAYQCEAENLALGEKCLVIQKRKLEFAYIKNIDEIKQTFLKLGININGPRVDSYPPWFLLIGVITCVVMVVVMKFFDFSETGYFWFLDGVFLLADFVMAYSVIKSLGMIRK